MQIRLKHIGLALSLIAAPVMAHGQSAQAQIGQADSAEAISSAQGTLERALPLAADAYQDFCVSVISTFPDSGHVPRYMFYRLSQELAVDATPGFKAGLDQYAGDEIGQDKPIMDVIEDIANPVLRQVAPELAIANINHLINFAHRCEPSITGQVSSLRAFDATLTASDGVIAEDALYLRQILSDSLYRLDVDEDPLYSATVSAYAVSLVRARDDIEFAAYTSEIDEIESLFMNDLDGRLARSNDMINTEIDREILGDAVILSDDMNEAAENERKRGALETLFRILN